MKILLTALLLVPAIASAQYRPLETRDDAARRHSAERYQTDRDRGGQPLGGYRERLGDPGGAEPRSAPYPTYSPPTTSPRRDDPLTPDRGFNESLNRPRR